MNEVQLFIKEVFPTASQVVIQPPEAWIEIDSENKTRENFLVFDKVNGIFTASLCWVLIM